MLVLNRCLSFDAILQTLTIFSDILTDYKTEKTLCKFNDSIVKPFRKLDTNLRQRLYE